MSFDIPSLRDWVAICFVALALIVLAHQEEPMIASQPRRGLFAWIRALRERRTFTVWGRDPDDPGFFTRIKAALDPEGAPPHPRGPQLGPNPFGTDDRLYVTPPALRDDTIVLQVGDYTRRGRHRQTGEALKAAAAAYNPQIPLRLDPAEMEALRERLQDSPQATRVDLPCTQPRPLPPDPSGQRPPWDAPTKTDPEPVHQWESGDSSGPPTIVMKVLRPEIEENIGKYVEGLPKYGDQQ